VHALEHLVLGHDGAVYLEHLLLVDEVLSPQREDVCLDRAARRAEVVQAGDAVVNLERRPEEEAAG